MWPLPGEEGVEVGALEEGGGEEVIEVEELAGEEERWAAEVVATGAGDLFQTNKQEGVEELSAVSILGLDTYKEVGLDTMTKGIKEASIKAGMEDSAKKVKDSVKEVEDSAKQVEDSAREVED